MRKIYFVLLLALIAPLFTMAQELVLTPQVGVQSSNTKVGYNNSPYFLPSRAATGLAGFRLTYQSKKGHGPYIGFGLATTTTTYKLADPVNKYSSYQGAMTDIFRIEGGYQWNTKPIYLKRIWDNHMSADEFARLKNKGWSVRIQPYAGFGMQLRNGNTGYETVQTNDGSITTYYGKRNWNITTGLNFEFGKNDKKKFTLGFSFIQGLGGMQTTVIDRTYNGTNYQTQLYNRSSGFNVTLGIPLTLWKKR
jgi:hypothetical protein